MVEARTGKTVGIVAGTLGLVLVLGVLGVLALKIPFVSRATDGPSFCGSCHVMGEQVSTFSSSAHAGVATCGSCHIEPGVVRGAFGKARVGLIDAYSLITGGYPVPLKLSDSGRTVLRENCLTCHAPKLSSVSMPADRQCTDCHRFIGHKRPPS